MAPGMGLKLEGAPQHRQRQPQQSETGTLSLGHGTPAGFNVGKRPQTNKRKSNQTNQKPHGGYYNLHTNHLLYLPARDMQPQAPKATDAPTSFSIDPAKD